MILPQRVLGSHVALSSLYPEMGKDALWDPDHPIEPNVRKTQESFVEVASKE